MTEYMNTYCPECDMEIQAILRERPATLAVRGEQVDYSELMAVCPKCGNAVGDARVEGENLERAYAVYRRKFGILSPQEVRDLRESYGLSLREFSRFLGFGEQTAYRYERGDIPALSHNYTMRSAATVDGARLLLSQNGRRLSGKSIAHIERRIEAMADGSGMPSRWLSVLERREGEGPSSKNGYRRLDLNRVSALVYELAGKCHDLYWTKLQKAMFFADAVSYERFGQSLTGLSYAHATYGPVVDRKDEMRCVLTDSGIVSFKECGWGEVLVPLQFDERLFDENELALIDEVAHFANSFNTASELSNFSHQLSCWSESADGEFIDYTKGSNEVEKAMCERSGVHGKVATTGA